LWFESASSSCLIQFIGIQQNDTVSAGILVLIISRDKVFGSWSYELLPILSLIAKHVNGVGIYSIISYDPIIIQQTLWYLNRLVCWQLSSATNIPHAFWKRCRLQLISSATLWFLISLRRLSVKCGILSLKPWINVSHNWLKYTFFVSNFGRIELPTMSTISGIAVQSGVCSPMTHENGNFLSSAPGAL